MFVPRWLEAEFGPLRHNSKVKLELWLCRSDARQVFDLPSTDLLLFGSPTRGHRPLDLKKAFRQVGDLPRIGVA